ncbi:hypothetical protein HDU98_002442 [Podochytrium sp. JEL0797]|nr:hypothetical protein HDU98_002442 [Podochytrium sp. JEL0797]
MSQTMRPEPPATTHPFPTEIIQSILIHMPAATVLSLRRVSKAFNKSLLDPAFAQRFLQTRVKPQTNNIANDMKRWRSRRRDLFSDGAGEAVVPEFDEFTRLLFHWPSEYQSTYISLEISLAKCTKLQWSSQSLTGRIPSVIATFSNLTSLNLSENNLAGCIPASLGSLRKLRELNLSSNAFTGVIPDTLGNLTHLHTLSICFTAVAGPLPASLGNCLALRNLFICSNPFLKSAIPREFGGLVDLRVLYLSGNRLFGRVPVELGELVVLEEMKLAMNANLVGRVPALTLKAAVEGRLKLDWNGNEK